MQSIALSRILQTLVLLQWITSHQTLNVQLDNTNLLQQPLGSISDVANNNKNRFSNDKVAPTTVRRWSEGDATDEAYRLRQHSRNYRNRWRRPPQAHERPVRDLHNHIKFKVMPRSEKHGHGHGHGHGMEQHAEHHSDDDLFSPWTAWGRCDKQCYQFREKYCQKKPRCGGIKHYEQRSCSKHLCFEHNFKDKQMQYGYGSSSEEHHHKKKKKRRKHHHHESEDEDDDEEAYHRPHAKKSAPEVHEHHVHHEHYDTSPSIPVVSHPAPPVYPQPYPIYHPLPAPQEHVPTYTQPIPIVVQQQELPEHRVEKPQFVVVKQNVVRKFPKRKQMKPIVIQVDDYDSAGHNPSINHLGYDDMADYEGDESNILLKVLRQNMGDMWNRRGYNQNRRIIANKVMLPVPAPTPQVRNITVLSPNGLMKILSASKFDYPHSSREFFSTSTDNLMTAMPEMSTRWRPFTITRGPAPTMATTPDFDIMKFLMGSTSATPTEVMATAKQDTVVSDIPFLSVDDFNGKFLDSTPHPTPKTAAFEFLESFHKSFSSSTPAGFTTRRAEANDSVGLDDLLNEYDKLDPANSQHIRKRRYLSEETGDDEHLVSSDELLVKFGGKRGKEKAVFELPRKPEALYSKWSKWSKCTPKCTTRRFKKCRARTLCGNDIIREVAYCYTEASFCQEWINQQMYNNYPPVPTATVMKPVKPGKINRRVDSNANAIQSNQISNSISRRGTLLPEFQPKNFECGVPTVKGRSGKQAPWNMLRIIGGKTARRGQWPWQVMILNRFKEPFCGGTLIAPQWVLTAAHCCRKRLYVRIGEHNLKATEGSELEFRIQHSIKHPKYDKKTVDSDVAMLKLARPVEKTNYIGFACLPQRYTQLPVGKVCTIIGWGKRRHSDDAGTNLLHEAEVPIISNEDCKNVYYDYTITKNMFCAGHKKGRVDTCAGDSGGPLLCRDSTKANEPWTIYGITSFGDGCGKKNKFGIYAKLANYVDWIWSVVNCDGECRN